MLFIIEKNTPQPAKDKLRIYGEVLEFSTNGITYPQISNHPDIFFCKSKDSLFYAPNIPFEFFDVLKSKGIKLTRGSSPAGKQYPDSAKYNAVYTEKYFIHNKNITDISILNSLNETKIIDVKQGYCRCNLLPLKNDSFITSDQGIYKKLAAEKLNVLYVDPVNIILPGADYGFFGGASGSSDNTIYLTGSIKYIPNGINVRTFLMQLEYNIVELYDGPLFDGGSILIIDD